MADFVTKVLKGDQVLVNPDHLLRQAYENRTGDKPELTEAPPAVPVAGRGRPRRPSPRRRRSRTAASRRSGAPICRAGVLLEEVAGVGDHVRQLPAERGGEPPAGLERQHRV